MEAVAGGTAGGAGVGSAPGTESGFSLRLSEVVGACGWEAPP